MRIRQCFALACGIALFVGATVAVAQAGGSAASADQGDLVKVKSRLFDSVYMLPGADFRGYTKVMLDPTQVSLTKSWLSDMNHNRIAILTRTTDADAQQVVEEARTGFSDILSDALKNAGYEIVAAPGAGVLRLSPRVVDLYVNAPRSVTTSLPASRVYTSDAGEATLALEARDSTTGTLLWRVVDRRTAGVRVNLGNTRQSVRLTTPVSNRFDFGGVFDIWAQSFIKSIDDLKAQSPVATTSPAR